MKEELFMYKNKLRKKIIAVIMAIVLFFSETCPKTSVLYPEKSVYADIHKICNYAETTDVDD